MPIAELLIDKRTMAMIANGNAKPQIGEKGGIA
jgi:hypothetical protein